MHAPAGCCAVPIEYVRLQSLNNKNIEGTFTLFVRAYQITQASALACSSLEPLTKHAYTYIFMLIYASLNRV
jgi:hypothetical protein